MLLELLEHHQELLLAVIHRNGDSDYFIHDQYYAEEEYKKQLKAKNNEIAAPP
jgi:hypothetical protein